jgi:peptide chain release factor subunit 1
MPLAADLRKLAELTAPERVFLTVYLAGPYSVQELGKRFERIRRVLTGGGPEKDERECFDENVRLVWEYLERHPLKKGSLCVFSAWVLDYFEAIPLQAPVNDLVWIDSSPYLRPLAELHDEYENVAVVVADNKKARIYLVACGAAEADDVIKGNIKNHVKKGGWSQQRYERRRDKELLHYAREIVDALQRLAKEEHFRRIVLVGGKEILRHTHDNLPHALRNMAGEKAVDLRKGDRVVNEEILELFREQERQSERDLWDKIRAEYLREGLGVVGLHDVLQAAREGRAEQMIATRDFRPEGRRCRDCGDLHPLVVEHCLTCGSRSLFEVDVVNEIVELLERSGARVDFADPIPTLEGAGGIAALLRY